MIWLNGINMVYAWVPSINNNNNDNNNNNLFAIVTTNSWRLTILFGTSKTDDKGDKNGLYSIKLNYYDL